MSTTPSAWNAAQPTKGPILQQPANVQLVQGRMVQHHYVRAQLRNINAGPSSNKLIDETLEALKHYNPNGKSCTPVQLLQGFAGMTSKLQQCNLAINFSAEGFFSAKNESKSYQQMYERASDIGGRVQLAANANNPPDRRVMADDKATFAAGHKSAAWGGVQRAMNPLHVGFMKTSNGTNHETQTASELRQDDGSVHIQNPFFNPKTKQVFAALNYGKQPHGPAPRYGMSYFVLSKKFKTNAIYFAGDTFLHEFGHRVTANDQVSFDLLGAIYAKAAKKNPTLREALDKVCFFGQTLPDSMDDCEKQLIEAHLFEPLMFTGGIERIHLSRKPLKAANPSLDGQRWEEIKRNAKEFAVKHGAQLHTLD